jgi:glycosyltransferase involved in cell wall biosynthesis
MKIAYIMSHRVLNGVTSSGTAQIRHLLARGHEVHLVHRPGAWIGRQDFEGAIHRHEVDMGRRWPNFRALRPVRDRLKAAGVEVSYSQGTHANVIGSIWRAQGLCPDVAKAAARIWHLHWPFHDAIIAPSRYAADWFIAKRLVRADRVHIVPSFVRSEDILPRDRENRAAARAVMGMDEHVFALTVIGSIDERKNQAAIVPIVAGLRARGIPAVARLIGGKGGGYARQVQQDIEAADLEDAIELMGHRDDARTLLPGFDALVCTSHDEQAPVVLVEAMAARLPPVSTAVGIVPDLIEPGVNGMILDLSDPSAAVDYLARLAADPAEVERQGAAARRTFDERLEAEGIMDRMEEVFAAAAAQRR